MAFDLSKRTKRILSAVLCGAVLAPAAAVPVAAYYNQALEQRVSHSVYHVDLSQSGYVLQRLGLITGDENGDLMLYKAGTRQEAFVIFLSLLGERSEAFKANYSYTFQDIDQWFSAYAGYGVYKYYTSGLSETAFGSYDTINAQQYMTFILRALGYGINEFEWTQSLNKAVEIGLCTQEQAYKWETSAFRRQEIMEISYLALNANLKNSRSTLADKLIAKGTITEQQAWQEHLTYGNTYIELENMSSKKISDYDSMPQGTYELHNLGTGGTMTAPAYRQADVTLASDTNAQTQMFSIIGNGNGSFRIVSAYSQSLVLDANPLNGADIILWDANGTDCQSFIAKEVSQGIYIIRLEANPDMVLAASGDDVRLCAYTGTAEQQWTLSANEENTARASQILASIMTVHPNGEQLGSGYSFAGARQCMGFGREVFSRMFGVTACWSYDGSPKSSADAGLYTITASTSSYSSNSIKNLISKAKPGDILQMNSPKMHTMVFVSCDDSGFIVYDANWVASNQVSVRRVSYGEWSGRNSAGITVLHAANYPTY